MSCRSISRNAYPSRKPPQRGSDQRLRRGGWQIVGVCENAEDNADVGVEPALETQLGKCPPPHRNPRHRQYSSIDWVLTAHCALDCAWTCSFSRISTACNRWEAKDAARHGTVRYASERAGGLPGLPGPITGPCPRRHECQGHCCGQLWRVLERVGEHRPVVSAGLAKLVELVKKYADPM